MAQLTDIRDKVLQKVGRAIKNEHQADDNLLTARVLQPFAAADMAWGILQEVCEPRQGEYTVNHEMKALYKRIKAIYTTKIFNANVGFLYQGMTMDEIVLFNDFMDKVTESVAHDIQILHYQLEDNIMNIDADLRKKICKVLTSEILALLAKDTLYIDLRVNFRELLTISNLTHQIAVQLFNQAGVKVILFKASMFERTLTALFKSITKVTTDGL